MKLRITLASAGAALIALAASILISVQPAQAAVGLHISGRNIVEANGSNFIMRGASHAHTWYPSQTGSFANIKSLGANTVRVVLSGGRWTANTASDVANVISLCKQNRLICVLENHDTTGYGEQSGAYTLDQAVNYWISIQSVLTGQENYVVINLGNEPFGNNAVTPDWTAATSAAIVRMRNAGFDHLLMVDAPNWGQDWQNVMRTNAATVFAADADRNTVFSVHMYGVYDTAAEITSYLDAFATAGLPLVIGEFGYLHSDGDPDEDTIMSQSVSRGIGYIGWSWSGNGGGVEYLDMVTNFDVNSLTTWGQRIFNGANGIKATAKEATIFGGSGPTATASPTSSQGTPTSSPTATSSPGTRTCTAAYSIVGQWQGGFQADVRVTAGGTAITAWTVTWTFANGQTITSSWNASVTVSGSTVTARNMSYNGSLAAGASTTFGFTGSWTTTNSTPTPSCTAS